MQSFASPAPARRFLGSVVVLTAAADFLLYRQRGGVALGVFWFLCYCAVRFNSRERRGGPLDSIIGLLLAATLIQSAIRFSLSNQVAAAALLSIAVVPRPDRGAAALLGAPALTARRWLRAPVFWPPLVDALRQSTGPGRPRQLVRWLLRAALVAVPAAIVLVPFFWLIGSGNAVLGHLFSSWADSLIRLLDTLNFPAVGRIAFWCAAAAGAITLLGPHPGPAIDRAWLEANPHFSPESDVAVGRLRSWVILGALAALFLAANLVDIHYMWMASPLPAGVNYSTFVREGVAELSVAAILGGITLALIARQDRAVSAHPATRRLSMTVALLLIGLIADSARRLLLDIDANALTVRRLSVLPFLILVATGLALLIWSIAAGKSLRWLLGANALATGALFIAIQFIDFRAIVADYNVDRYLAGTYPGWQSDRYGFVDIADNLVETGSSGWPAFNRLVQRHPELRTRFNAALSEHAPATWQSWQWSEWHTRHEYLSK